MMSILVIGGGPAGLSAAIHAAEAGAQVTIAERNDQCGRKLLITGGGRANISNTLPVEKWPALFGKRGRFIMPAMECLPLPKLLAWFADLGVPLECVDNFHYFPQSNSAKSVRDALTARAHALGVQFRRSLRLTSVPEGYDASIIATGGASYPSTGSTGDGYDLAKQLGHTIVPPAPGLVGLQTTSVPSDLAGLVLPEAEVVFKQKGRQEIHDTGELLLTHTSISGPAVLDISGTVAQALENAGGPVSLTIRWLAAKDMAFWQSQLESWRKNKGGTPLLHLLRDFLPARMVRWLCATAVTPSILKAEQRDALARNLGGFQAEISATEGWNKAMITRGGISTSQINPASLESRLAGNVYFAGEVIDIDGPCGGYNLHWAFASGALAGKSATTRQRAQPAI